MITPQAPFVKRQVRKLLLLICGSKEQYRQLRDMHTLETRVREVKITVAKGGFDLVIQRVVQLIFFMILSSSSLNS